MVDEKEEGSSGVGLVSKGSFGKTAEVEVSDVVSEMRRLVFNLSNSHNHMWKCHSRLVLLA